MEAVTEFRSGRTFGSGRTRSATASSCCAASRRRVDPTRIEVLVKDVRYVALPTTMEGLTFHRCDASEVPPELSSLSPEGPWVRVGSGGVTGYVAGVAFVSEDELDYDDPSAFDFAHSLGPT